MHDADYQARSRVEGAGTVQPREKEYFRKDGSRVRFCSAHDFGDKTSVAFVLDLDERKRAETSVNSASLVSRLRLMRSPTSKEGRRSI